jgi:hypothetical protein
MELIFGKKFKLECWELALRTMRLGEVISVYRCLSGRVAHPYHCNADPEPSSHFNANPVPDSALVMGICGCWSFDPPGLHFEPPGLFLGVHGPPQLYFAPPKLLSFYFNAAPEPETAFHSNADSDPETDQASKNNADP